MTRTPPLVILGLDAADPDLLLQWSRDGYLPTHASIMARGTYGYLTGPDMLTEHSVWVTLASGCGLDQHNYYYLRQLRPGTYDLEVVDKPQNNLQPFWAYLRGPNKKVAILDVPRSFPVAGLPGFQISDWAPHYNLLAPAAQPPEALAEIQRHFGPRWIIDERLEATLEQDRNLYQVLRGRLQKKGHTFRQLISENAHDLAFVVFSETHTAGHQFWNYRPGSSKAAHTEFNTALRDIYQAADHELGLILNQLPAEANIFCLSSCGLQDQYPMTGMIEDFCRKLAYQVAPPARAAGASPMTVIRRWVPESWRVALSRNLSRSARERLLSDRFRTGSDWSRTTAFAIPSFYNSFLRVNLRGREPQGIVEPGREYEAMLDRLESDLHQLYDPATGAPAVKKVERTVRLFGGEPPLALPDLYVEWQPVPHLVTQLIHPKAVLTQSKPEFYRSTDHTRLGFLAAAGPSLAQRGKVSDINALDVAPTFLSLLGVQPPPEMRGRAADWIAR